MTGDLHERGTSGVRPPEAVMIRDLESPTVRVVRAVERRLALGDFYRARQVIGVLAARDFKVKYKQSVFGPLWLIFQPLALLAAFLVAFQGVADVRSGAPYVPFALIGLSAWAFFQAAMIIGTASMISNATLVRFTPCPRQAFPVAAIIASVPAYVITITGAVIATIATGALSPRALLLPVGFTWLFLLTAGFVAITSALSVRYRDLLSAMPFLLQIGLFLAPIAYPLDGLSGLVRIFVELNPLSGVIEASRWMVLAGYQPSLAPIGASLLLTPIIIWVGWRVFSRLETTMADEM